MKLTYLEVFKLAKYGRQGHGYSTYPTQLACKKLTEKGILEIYPNTNEDGDGIPDIIYPSITSASNNANTRYKQKGVHYAAWYPIAEK